MNNKIVKFFHNMKDKRMIIMLCLGFSSGLPLSLIFSSLSLWLKEAGMNKSSITFFSWAALGYSFKFVWSPLVDKLPLPFLTKVIGRRKGWIFISQIMVIFSICLMAFSDPADKNQIVILAMGSILLGFFSATQDIAIDAYRIELAKPHIQGLLSSFYVSGYRIGMLFSGAGSLFLASAYGSNGNIYSYLAWKYTYITMAIAMTIGITASLVSRKAQYNRDIKYSYSTKDYLHFLILFLAATIIFAISFYYIGHYISLIYKNLNPIESLLNETLKLSLSILFAYLFVRNILKTKFVNQALVMETYILPISDFFKRYGKKSAFTILALIGLYRISDIVLGVIANVFYQDMGFTKVEIATISKTFGLICTLIGGFIGGSLASNYGVLKILFLGALTSSLTNILFIVQSLLGHNVPFLYLVISLDNLAAGIASTAFIAFLSSLTNIRFTAVQYAIFSSLMTLIPKTIGGYSGSIISGVGYPMFFTITTILGIPVLLLIIKQMVNQKTSL